MLDVTSCLPSADPRRGSSRHPPAGLGPGVVKCAIRELGSTPPHWSQGRSFDLLSRHSSLFSLCSLSSAVAEQGRLLTHLGSTLRAFAAASLPRSLQSLSLSLSSSPSPSLSPPLSLFHRVLAGSEGWWWRSLPRNLRGGELSFANLA